MIAQRRAHHLVATARACGTIHHDRERDHPDGRGDGGDRQDDEDARHGVLRRHEQDDQRRDGVRHVRDQPRSAVPGHDPSLALEELADRDRQQEPADRWDGRQQADVERRSRRGGR
jgi:hypothetical protein